MKEKSLLANELVRQRKKHNLTQKAVAKIIGVTVNAVGNWENDRHRPKDEAFEKLEEIYSLKENYFMHFLEKEEEVIILKKGDVVQTKDKELKVEVLEDCLKTDERFAGRLIESLYSNSDIGHEDNWLTHFFELCKKTEVVFKEGDVVQSENKRLKVQVTEDCCEDDTYFKGIVLESSYTDIPIKFEDIWVAEVFEICERKRKVIQKDVFYTLKKGSGYISNLMTASDGETTLNIRNAIHCFYPSKRYKTLAETYDAKIVKIVQTFEEVEND